MMARCISKKVLTQLRSPKTIAMVLGLRNWVSTFFEMHLAIMGLVFIAVVIWAPGGVIGQLQRIVERKNSEGPP